jgi:hypothetical protein
VANTAENVIPPQIIQALIAVHVMNATNETNEKE